MIGLFKAKKPRHFQHNYIYINQHKEIIKKIYLKYNHDESDNNVRIHKKYCYIAPNIDNKNITNSSSSQRLQRNNKIIDSSIFSRHYKPKTRVSLLTELNEKATFSIAKSIIFLVILLILIWII